MKLHQLSILFLPISLLADSSMPTATLNEQRADAIIAVEMAEKKAKQESEKPNFRVLQRREINFGDRRLTLDEVAKPNLPRKQVTSQAVTLTPEQQQAMLNEMAAIEWVSLSIWVYDFEISQVRWTHEGEMYVAWVPADLNPCRMIRDFTVEEHQYQLSMMILNEDTKLLKERQKAARQEGVELDIPDVPKLPKAKDGVTTYYVESDDDAVFENIAAFQGIEGLLTYFDKNHDSLVAKLKEQTVLNDARKRYQEANPPSNNAKIVYWIKE